VCESSACELVSSNTTVNPCINYLDYTLPQQTVPPPLTLSLRLNMSTFSPEQNDMIQQLCGVMGMDADMAKDTLENCGTLLPVSSASGW